MSERVLCIDDDPNILAGYQRILHARFRLDTARSAKEALSKIQHGEPYAVVVSDLRMPEMDGIALLTKVRELSPDTVRIVLTGYADIQMAMAAVNEGSVFRFLAKPCPPEHFAKALEAALRQYRLQRAERELLELTLRGVVDVLAEVLAMVNPLAFSQSTRLRRIVRHMGQTIGVSDLWQYEVAALLSQVGCLVLPQDLLEKVYADLPLSEEEELMYASRTTVGHKLLSAVPRMEKVAAMIARQNESFPPRKSVEELRQADPELLGGQMIKVALAFDNRLLAGASQEQAIGALAMRDEEFQPHLVATLYSLPSLRVEMKEAFVRLRDLNTTMVLAEDVFTRNGLLLAKNGQEVSMALLHRLQNFARRIGVREPIRVLVPRVKEEETANTMVG
ncbi:MAG: response regulator [candidate division KSB1 bacterium]|nr:response regulator [candidate division KSB1 bacterium]